MGSIFVSYRRSDSQGEAGRLFDDLVKHFGEHTVFMDVSAIEAGRDFRRAIEDAVAKSDVLLVVIGPDWLDAKDEHGAHRLDDPSDFVRIETSLALKQNIRVIPVLVRGTKMPSAEQLPEDLKELAFRNAAELTHARWRWDVQLLIEALRRQLGLPAPTETEHSEPRLRRYALYGVLALLFAKIVLPYFTGGKPEKFKDTLEASVLLITVISQVAPIKKPGASGGTSHNSFRLAPSFMSGWYGGILGGAIAGVVVGLGYYFGVHQRYSVGALQIISPIFGWATLAGFFLGATSQLGAQFATYLSTASIAPAFVANEVVGGGLGAAFGGIFVGGYGGWIFGYRPLPVVDPGLVAVGGVVGAFALCAGALLYGYRGRVRDVARVFFFSLIPTLVAAGVGFYVIVSQDIGRRYFSFFDSRVTNLRGGAYMGAIMGTALGVQVGCTLLLYRLTNKPVNS